jgi:hypothetical protein
MLREAEVEAVAAQHHLAALLLLPQDSPLPLPADQPHVGPYRTRFAELFSGRPAPERAALLDRTLAIRCRAIDSHAAAVQAADDAMTAAAEAQAAGQGRLSTTLMCLGEHFRQRRALMACVGRYNRDIADYALAVAAPQTIPEALVGMMIKSGRDPARPAAATENGGVQPASHNAPVAAPVKNRPTRAVRPSAPPPDSPSPSSEPTSEPSSPTAVPPGKHEPTLAPPREKTPADGATGPAAHEARKAIAEVSSAPAASYAELRELPPGSRTQRLTTLLHEDRDLPPGAVRPLRLDECLRAAPGASRLAVIDAFWLARQRAAEYQALARQAQWLEAVVPLLLEGGAQTETGKGGQSPVAAKAQGVLRTNRDSPLFPDAAEAMLQLRCARLATEAAKADAHVALVEAQFDVARWTGRTGDTAWPLASTVPCCGGFALRAASGQGPAGASWPQRRWAATIPASAEAVAQRATAVVAADAARAAAVAAYQAGRQPWDDVLVGIYAETEQTLALLQALSQYNQSIAAYVTVVLPSSTPPDALAAALVPQP